MAQRFISGLFHQYASNDGGRFISRLLIEWLTQVVNWPVVDLIGSKWNNVLVSGTGTANATAALIVEITSGTPITSSHVNWFLTITGFSGGNAKYDGIYKIKRVLNAAGGVYTIEVWPYGVHHNGFPIQSGLNWRLWAGNDTYCPSATTEIAVLQGKGCTGAGLSDGTRSSVSLNISQGGSTSTLTDSSATFLASDVGKNITISGSAVSGNNNTFTIASRISATSITYTNASGGDDAFTGSWSITYPYHWWYKCNAAGKGYGRSIIAPFASWNSTSHVWADSRYTAEIGTYDSYYGTQWMYIWAEADLDHFTFTISGTNDPGGSNPNTSVRAYAVGELESFSPEYDSNPVWVWVGDVYYYGGGEYYHTQPLPSLGFGGPGYTMYDRFRGLSYDDLTTLVYNATLANNFASANTNMYHYPWRVLSKFSNKFYLSPIILQSITSDHMELRGKLRHIFNCHSHLPLGYPLGISGEYLHSPVRGIVIPWNNSTALASYGTKSAVG